MRTIDNVNIAQAYIEGMLWAAFGVRIFSENMAEWQIEVVEEMDRRNDQWFQRCGEEKLFL
ncbi:MAG: hypothetical protein IJK70_05345 [Bacteroidales bacterium]|nr:hypothetical protein [Bacteroidales bacterium]